eukprot:jgi/Botrbrau1/17376/Bobra.0494s0002.1
MDTPHSMNIYNTVGLGTSRPISKTSPSRISEHVLHSPPPACCTSCWVRPPCTLPKTSRRAMLSCCRVNHRMWPSEFFHSKTSRVAIAC